jgi:hypothetical protein
LAVSLAAAVFFRKRRLKKTNGESWEALHAACTTSTRKIAKAPEAAWITALRASVAKDARKPGLKRSTKEQVPQLQSHSEYTPLGGGDTAQTYVNYVSARIERSAQQTRRILSALHHETLFWIVERVAAERRRGKPTITPITFASKFRH